MIAGGVDLLTGCSCWVCRVWEMTGNFQRLWLLLARECYVWVVQLWFTDLWWNVIRDWVLLTRIEVIVSLWFSRVERVLMSSWRNMRVPSQLTGHHYSGGMLFWWSLRGKLSSGVDEKLQLWCSVVFLVAVVKFCSCCEARMVGAEVESSHLRSKGAKVVEVR